MNAPAITPDWIGLDWGSTHLRAWAMSAGGNVLARISVEKGTGGLSREQFEPALLDTIAPWLQGASALPVIACGMIGSRQGWAEAAYLSAPSAPPHIGQATRLDVAEGRLHVYIMPGIKQQKPADVMRGEETQIAGFLRTDPDFDGVVCLPGTHSKWVRISAGEIVSFQTFLTGEMFALLSERSVLRHVVGEQGWDDRAYLEAVSDALSNPALVAARLFALRAEGLLQNLEPARARARLSGLLIGLEMGGARRYWLGQNVALIGAGELNRVYGAALADQGVMARETSGETMALAGLARGFHRLTGDPSAQAR